MLLNFELEPLWIALIWFTVFIAHYKINVGYYIRRVFKLSQTKGYKLIDCFPCQSFWIALLATFNPLTAMLVFFMAQTTEK